MANRSSGGSTRRELLGGVAAAALVGAVPAVAGPPFGLADALAKGSPSRPSSYPAAWNVVFTQPSPGPWAPPPRPARTHLAKGKVMYEGGLPLPCDIVWEKDLPVVLRDGVVIYADVLRPAGQAKDLPAIVSWSPYGKALPSKPPAGVSEGEYSGLAKSEGADPAYWCDHGYAVIHPNPRGVARSDGRGYAFGRVDANDGYDVTGAGRASYVQVPVVS